VKLSTIIGRSEPQPADDEQVTQLREARIGHARGNPRWHELEEVALVRRPPGYLVDADSDAVYKAWRGTIYARGEVRSSFASETELWWFVAQHSGEIVFLERLPGTWSDVVAKRAKRQARA
jgi:hypothetical protein